VFVDCEEVGLGCGVVVIVVEDGWSAACVGEEAARKASISTTALAFILHDLLDFKLPGLRRLHRHLRRGVVGEKVLSKSGHNEQIQIRSRLWCPY
jgi:hypothetical protein